MNNRHKYSDSDFIEAVKTSLSIREALNKLSLVASGSAYYIFHSRVKKLGIDTSHFTGQGHLKNKTHGWSKKISLEDLLIANSDRILKSQFKKRLIKEHYLENKCTECFLTETWNGKPIVLQIDHINGDHFDHRIENLRLLCPNCHSQTETFCSRNKGNKYFKFRKSEFLEQEKIEHICLNCSIPLQKGKSKYCKQCYNYNRKQLQQYEDPTKIAWLSNEELKSKLETMSYTALGRELGVSDNAIRKHLNKTIGGETGV